MSVGIVCEFNPFHNGHKYLINKAKKIANEPVIVVMSGAFTQRGECAITDKFFRAKTALENGADLVIELPVVFAISNAERFAKCGIEILQSFKNLNYIAFGCEKDDINLLKQASLLNENKDVQNLISIEMKKGGYYPKAFEYSVREICGDELANIISSPNNILAIEYIRNIKENINIIPIKRQAVEHDSKIANGNFASASYIRDKILNKEDILNFVPKVPQNICNFKNLEVATLYKLRSMKIGDFAKLPDVKEGLENRIYQAVQKKNSIEEIIAEIKTKRYTHARIRRIIACALLDITENMQSCKSRYARILGFTEAGSSLLKECNIPVITSVKSGLNYGGEVEELLNKDIYAQNIAGICYDKLKSCNLDFTMPIIKEKYR